MLTRPTVTMTSSLSLSSTKLRVRRCQIRKGYAYSSGLVRPARYGRAHRRRARLSHKINANNNATARADCTDGCLHIQGTTPLFGRSVGVGKLLRGKFESRIDARIGLARRERGSYGFQTILLTEHARQSDLTVSLMAHCAYELLSDKFHDFGVQDVDVNEVICGRPIEGETCFHEEMHERMRSALAATAIARRDGDAAPDTIHYVIL